MTHHRPEKPHKPPSDNDRILQKFDIITGQLEEIKAANHEDASRIVNAIGQSGPVLTQEIGLRVSSVRGKGCNMPRNIDRGSMNLLDTEGVILSIAAKNAAGEVQGNPPEAYSWASADETNAKIEVQTPHADDAELTGYERWVGTPGEANAAVVITVTHTASGNTETLTLNIASTGPGEIGLSAGSAILEP